jgi:hypothetical protein
MVGSRHRHPRHRTHDRVRLFRKTTLHLCDRCAGQEKAPASPQHQTGASPRTRTRLPGLKATLGSAAHGSPGTRGPWARRACSALALLAVAVGWHLARKREERAGVLTGLTGVLLAMPRFTIVPHNRSYWVQAMEKDGSRVLVEHYSAEEEAIRRLRVLQGEAGTSKLKKDPVSPGNR